jgi:hypothetical protein
MDKLIADQEAGKPVMVTITEHNKRVCAELFKIDGGVAFVDIGWNQAGGCSFHPVHMVRGEINGTTITDELGRVFVFRAITEEDREIREWRAWERSKHEQGSPYNRQRLKKMVEEDSSLS